MSTVSSKVYSKEVMNHSTESCEMIYEYLSKVNITQDYLFHNTEHNCVLLNFMTRFLIMPETNWLIDRENKFDSRKNATNGAAEQKMVNFLIDKVQEFEDLDSDSG